jgi:formyl-CoA transferase
MSGPLSGIRVVELASFISGPYAAMLLADLGAEVYKVEPPEAGDPFRQWGGKPGRHRPNFSAYNRGKRSATINLRSDGGRQMYMRLAQSADVVIENFRPGTVDRLGVGYTQLKELNPALVYCSITGLGSTGPYRDRPTYDAIAQAMSGLWSTLTDMENPEPVGPPMSDQLTGLYAAYGVLGALVARQRSGRGQHLEVSMLSANVAFMTGPISNYLFDGEISDRSSRARRSQSYALLAKDGRPLAIHLSSLDKFWLGLLEAAGLTELAEDPRFSTKSARVANYDELRAILSRVFRTRDRAEWLNLLEREDVPAAPIYNIEETLADPQVRHLELVQSFGDGARSEQLVGFAVRYDKTPSAPDLPTPLLGEHNEEVLKMTRERHVAPMPNPLEETAADTARS